VQPEGKRWIETVKGELIPIHAIAYLNLPKFEDRHDLVRWVEVYRLPIDEQTRGPLWQQTYANHWITVKPGTVQTPEFHERLEMPAGEYPVVVGLAHAELDENLDTVRGKNVVLHSFSATVP
jgi:hypothetical protein